MMLIWKRVLLLSVCLAILGIFVPGASAQQSATATLSGAVEDPNGDLVAGAIAGALHAEKLVMMTDIKGIRDAKGRHLSTVSRKDVQRMVKKGTITEGMLPKVHACLDALEQGVGKAHIIDGRIPHAILLEVFTRKGIGTEITA